MLKVLFSALISFVFLIMNVVILVWVLVLNQREGQSPGLEKKLDQRATGSLNFTTGHFVRG